jgi:hypothetical protein
VVDENNCVNSQQDIPFQTEYEKQRHPDQQETSRRKSIERNNLRLLEKPEYRKFNEKWDYENAHVLALIENSLRDDQKYLESLRIERLEHDKMSDYWQQRENEKLVFQHRVDEVNREREELFAKIDAKYAR